MKTASMSTTTTKGLPRNEAGIQKAGIQKDGVRHHPHADTTSSLSAVPWLYPKGGFQDAGVGTEGYQPTPIEQQGHQPGEAATALQV